MSTTRTRTRRTVAGVGAAVVGMVAAAITAVGPAGAVQGFEFERLQGANRYATAAAIARDTFATADVVLLANGQDDDPQTSRNESHFPDALAGSYLAGFRGAPTLLTTEETLPAATSQALTDLGVETVVIIGGSAAVSTAQEQQLRSRGLRVERVAGTNRYETAAAVARAPGIGNTGSVGNRRTAVVASGLAFPDALVMGPLSYAGQLPLTITDPQRLSEPTRRVLEDFDIQQVLIPGGTAAVSREVQAEIERLGISVTRFAGQVRAETAALVAEYALANLSFTDAHVNLALGLRFPDALAGGPHGGRDRAPILLTAGVDSLGAAARGYLEDHSDTLRNGHIFGGTAAVSSRVKDEAEEAAQGDGTSPSPSPTTSPPSSSDTATVTIANRTVEAGAAVTGTVSGNNIRSVVVDGCGLRAEPVEDNSTTAGVQFSETIPSVQPPGDCVLVFTTSFTDGRTDRDSVTITVTAPRTVTTLPELTQVSVSDTGTSNNNTSNTATDDFTFTRVRFTFDEPVIGQAPVPSRFHLVGFDSATRYDGQSAIVESGGTSVLVTFGATGASVGPQQLEDVSLAVVDEAAVADNTGQQNPIGDRTLGTSRETPAFPAGETVAPDLLSVSSETATATMLTLAFTFDEQPVLTSPPALEEEPPAFHAVTAANRDQTCNNPVVSGKTVRVTCPVAATETVVRGFVDAGTVTDPPANSVSEGNPNVLQAADLTSDGTTTAPDLVSAAFLTDTSDTSTVLFTFDEPVFIGDAKAFLVYQADGDEVFSVRATRQSDPTQVVAVFEADDSDPLSDPTPALSNAVGVSVEDGAVIEAGGSNLANEEDEVAVDNPARTGHTAGRTDAPDLVSVRITPGSTPTATYTFDEALGRRAPTITDFFLYTSTGRRLQCVTGSPSGSTFTCTGFQIGSGTSARPAPAADVSSAVLGAVDDDAVQDAGSNLNPEGAEVTTGGTGTPAA